MNTSFKRGDHVVVSDKGFNRAIGVVVKVWPDNTSSVVWPKGYGNGGFHSASALRQPTDKELAEWPKARLPKLGW